MLKRSGEFNRSSFGQSRGEDDSVGLIHMTPEWYSLVVCSRVQSCMVDIGGIVPYGMEQYNLPYRK